MQFLRFFHCISTFIVVAGAHVYLFLNSYATYTKQFHFLLSVVSTESSWSPTGPLKRHAFIKLVHLSPPASGPTFCTSTLKTAQIFCQGPGIPFFVLSLLKLSWIFSLNHLRWTSEVHPEKAAFSEVPFSTSSSQKQLCSTWLYFLAQLTACLHYFSLKQPES